TDSTRTPAAATLRDTAPPPRPVPAPAVPQAAAKPIISHADSVAIAAAIEKRIAAARARDSAEKARIAEQTQRKMLDSIIAANSGAGGTLRAGPRRVAIVEP